MIVRKATSADAETVARIAIAGFDTYREFVPGFVSPPLQEDVSRLREDLADRSYWCRVAADSEGPLGVVGFRRSEIEPGLVHLQRLFVLPRGWGTGVAPRLHGLAIVEMRRCSFEQARLFTPAGQARARAFYEREGWRVRGEPFPEPRLANLELVEYRRVL